MTLKIGSNFQLRAMLALWGYDILKFLIGFQFMNTHGINPWMFLFLDMITVPPYILGWHILIASLTGKDLTIKKLLQWSFFTLISSLAPYSYAAWSGRQALPSQAWVVLCLIMFFLAASLLKKIYIIRMG